MYEDSKSVLFLVKEFTPINLICSKKWSTLDPGTKRRVFFFKFCYFMQTFVFTLFKKKLKSTKCFSKLNKNSSSALNASSTTSPSNSSSSPSSPKKKNAFKIFIREFLNLKNYFSLKKFLRYLPISNVLHIILAFNFIFPSIFLTAKEIEYDLRPSSKL